MGVSATFPLMCLALLLVCAAAEDIRRREIANWKNAAIALLAPLWWWTSGYAPWPDMAAQLGLGFAVLALFAVPFALGWMGGGDVKMLAALALWLPLPPLLGMIVVMSVAGFALTLASVLLHRLRRAAGPVETPYGVAIAAAALFVFREPIINHLLHR